MLINYKHTNILQYTNVITFTLHKMHSNMKKKIILIVSVIFIITIALVTFFFMHKGTNETNLTPHHAIPDNPSFVIEVNTPSKLKEALNTEKSILYNFTQLFNLNKTNFILQYIDSIQISEDIIRDNSKFILSFHPEGENSLTHLMVIPTNKNENILDSINSKLEKIGRVNSRNFKNITLYEYNKDSNGLPDIHYFCDKGLLVLSLSQKMLENSANKLSEDFSIFENNNALKQLLNSAGQNEVANFYLNLSVMPNIIQEYVTENFTPTIKHLKNISEWTELDLSISDDRITLNGFSIIEDSSVNLYSILNTQASKNLSSISILPNSTDFYLNMAMTNTENFDLELDKYLGKLDEKDTRNANIANIKSKYGVDIKSTFYPMINNEICFALINTTNNKKLKENAYTIFDVKSQSNTALELDNLVEKISQKTGKDKTSYTSELQIDNNTKLKIYILPFIRTPELLFGNYFEMCNGNYVCCIDNYIVFANSKQALHRFAYDVVLNNTLKTSIDHNNFLENFSSESGMLIYFAAHNSTKILNEVFKNSNITPELLSKIGNIGFQVNKNHDMLYNNLVIQKSDNISVAPQTTWESRLDATIITKPTIVTNHNNNSKEILIQDEENTLYLLGNSGREIWRVNINETIESEIYQIDLFKNGKLQYLFSTKSKIHLIDRLGNYVEKYPIKLRSNATAPMNLFDYEKDKTYRIIIPCEDMKVYLYDGEGSIIKGWTFENSENKVSNEISHYRIKDEDFIVFKDKYKAYFVNRTGEAKQNFLTKFEFSENNKFWLDTKNSEARFVTTDNNGVLRFFYPNGKQDSLRLDKFSSNHYFALKDMNSDGTNEYVFVDSSLLSIYNSDKKLVLSHELENNILSEPDFYRFPDNSTKIGITCSSSGKIYLINYDGSLYNGFPLQGLTRFSIGQIDDNSDKFNLIVGGQNNLLYNYSISNN